LARKRNENAINYARTERESLKERRQAAEAELKRLEDQRKLTGYVGGTIDIERQKNVVASLRANEKQTIEAIRILREGYGDLNTEVENLNIENNKPNAVGGKGSNVRILGEQKAVEELTDSWKEYLVWRQKVREDQAEGRRLAEELPDVEFDDFVNVTPEDLDFITFEQIMTEFESFQLGMTEILTDQIDKRIELMQKESAAALSKQNYLEQLAAQGNITAQQSIAETIQIQRDAQEEIARLERQKQNIELISQGLSTFNAELEAGKTPTQALASTILSTQTLVGFLKNIQFFAKGTQYAPEGMAVVDEQGAELITDSSGKIKQLGSDGGSRMTHLNRGDKVYTAQQTSEMLGAFSGVENASLINSVDGHAGNSFDLMMLNKSLHDIKDAVKNAPTNNMDWGGLSRVIPEFSKQTNKAGDVHTTRYKVKR